MKELTKSFLKELKNRLAKAVTWGYWIGLFIVLLEVPREISRGEKSAWVWEQYGIVVSQQGGSAYFGTLAFLILTYAIFYSAGFVLPYYLLCWIFARDIKQNEVGDVPSVRFSIRTISLACGITLVVFLKSTIGSITAFTNNVPGQWFIVLWGLVTLVLLFAGISSLKQSRAKVRVVVRRRGSKVFGTCPSCGVECTFPGRDLAYYEEGEGCHNFG